MLDGELGVNGGVCGLVRGRWSCVHTRWRIAVVNEREEHDINVPYQTQWIFSQVFVCLEYIYSYVEWVEKADGSAGR